MGFLPIYYMTCWYRFVNRNNIKGRYYPCQIKNIFIEIIHTYIDMAVHDFVLKTIHTAIGYIFQGY